jgi:multiple sugar transport system permease protein
MMQGIRKFWKENGPGYTFLAPWFVGLFTLTLAPMFSSLYLSFTNYDLFTKPDWIGWGNFAEMFRDPRYLKSLEVTAGYVFIGVPLQLAVAFSLALLLNRGIRGLSLYRAVYYLPSLFGGSVAIAILWRQVFGGGGLVSDLLAWFGIPNQNWIADPEHALLTLIILHAWQFGSPMVIFLAGLKQIPTEIYESAAIDGAGRLHRLFRITIPLITPIVLFNTIMQIISAFQAFTPAYIVSGGSGGPLDSTLFYTLYLYKKGFGNFQMGYASAMAWTLLAIIATVTAIVFLTSRKWVYYEE